MKVRLVSFDLHIRIVISSRMEEFRLNADQIPPRLYRVQYNGSATIYHPDTSLMTRNRVKFHVNSLIGHISFGHAVEQHLNWDKTDGSIFISLFSDRTHAVNWMHSMKSNHEGGGNFRFLEVDSSQIGTPVFKASEIVEALGLDIPGGASDSVKNEYLVTNLIPGHAVVNCQSVEEIPRGMNFLVS